MKGEHGLTELPLAEEALFVRFRRQEHQSRSGLGRVAIDPGTQHLLDGLFVEPSIPQRLVGPARELVCPCRLLYECVVVFPLSNAIRKTASDTIHNRLHNPGRNAGGGARARG